MKKIFALFVIGSLTLAACSQKYTCPTYSKKMEKSKKIYASTKEIQKGKM